MSIDLTEPFAAGQHLAETVRRRTGEGLDAVREVDLHLPVTAEAVIAAASHGARRTQRKAKRAVRETRRSVETRVDRGSRQVRRRAENLSDQSTKPGVRVWVIGVLLVVGAAAIAAIAVKQKRSRPSSIASSDDVDLTSSDLNGSSPKPDPSRASTFAP